MRRRHLIAIALASIALTAVADPGRPAPPDEHDLAVAAIDSPPGPHVPPMVPFRPAASVRNAGANPEAGFLLFFTIADSVGAVVHRDSLAVADTLPVDSVRLCLLDSPFTPQPEADYEATAWVVLDGDGYPGDDTLRMPFSSRQYHDLAVVAIDTPAAFVVPPGLALSPAARVRDAGTYPESGFRVHCRISDSLSAVVYWDSLTVPALAAQAETALAFSPFTPESLAVYRAAVFTALAGDAVPGNDTAALDFRTFEYAGTVSGTVRDENAGGAPLAGALVSALSAGGNFSDTADLAGGYSFPALPAGTYSLCAAAPGYADSCRQDIVVAAGTALACDFALGYPALALTPSDSITVLLPPASCDSSRWLVLRNDGTRDASCVLGWPEAAAKAAGDSVWGIDLEGPTSDNLCLGVEHAGGGLWVSGAAGSPAADPNWLYRFDRDGVLSRTLPQPGGGGWGWRDLCWDGQFLYGASAGDIMQIDTADGDTTGVRITSPCAVARGLAYDGSADRFYVTDFGDSIYQVDRAGAVHQSWANPRNTFGLAWDAAADGPWLWCLNDSFAGGSFLSADQFDPRAGIYTGLRFGCNAIDPANAAAGGLAFSTALVPGRGTLIALLQDWHDRLVAYDVRPDNARWLALSRTALTLPPAGTDSVRLTFDNAGLDSALAYRAWIRVATGVAGRGDSVLAVLRSPSGVGGVAPITAPGFSLLPCRPNPARARTAITFSLPSDQDAELALYNIAGQLVRTLLAGRTAAGWHTVDWDGTDRRGRLVGSGVFLCRLRAGAGQRTIRMALVR